MNKDRDDDEFMVIMVMTSFIIKIAYINQKIYLIIRVFRSFHKFN